MAGTAWKLHECCDSCLGESKVKSKSWVCCFVLVVVFVLMFFSPQLLLKLIEDRAERKPLYLQFLELWEVTGNFQGLVFSPVTQEQLFVSSSRM